MKKRGTGKNKAIFDIARYGADVTRRLERLPTQRRKSVQPIFEKPGDFVLLSLRQIARKLHADPSTVLRTLRVLGFDHFADFRAYLHERVVAFATSSEPVYVPSQSGPLGLIRSSIECDLNNLKELADSLDPAKFMAVAKRVWEARRVVVLTGDMAVSLGTYFEYTLCMLGLNASRASTAGEMVHRTRALGKHDVVIAITYRRGLAHTVEAFRHASRNGAFCVGISDSYLSPLVDFSDEFFITATDRVSFADSYVSGMALLNAMLVAITSERPAASRALIQETAEEQRTGHRFYSKEADTARPSGRTRPLP
jgi:DNA-binding MurR/RpiR family transcriptional regulator